MQTGSDWQGSVMIGILVHGDNHFVVRGPFPDRAAAMALARHWSLIEIGKKTPPELERWRISTKEFREDLEWAVVVPGGVAGEQDASLAATVLLEELAGRGVRIYDASREEW
jgi:hypothetical protein